jgi:hypothetical protein
MSRANDIISAHRNGKYQGEGASALRDLRDAEGIIRGIQDFSMTASKVTVGRQWLEQALKDVRNLTDGLTAAQAQHAHLASSVNAQELSLAAKEVEVENLKAQLDKIPRWVRRLFGAF